MSTIIRELRDRTGLSQKKFADYFNIPVSTLRKWEQSEAEPAAYFIDLLAKQIPSTAMQLRKIVGRNGDIYFYDTIANTISDSIGNKITIHESLEGVKEQNLPLYVDELFTDYYEIIKKFDSDCMYDKKEDFIWR